MRLLILLFFGSISCTCFAQPVGDEEQVKQVDAELNKLILKNASASAASFYAEAFLLTTSSGKVKLKADLVKEIGSPDLSLAINETTEVNVRVLGSTAVLTGMLHQKGSYKGTNFDVKLRVTDTWVRTETGWKLLAGHASSFPKT
jgi:ketosteroid isomerase-like protein